ncbi:MAG: hypothetical protein AAF146_10240 [Bacteroidota bacterium]
MRLVHLRHYKKSLVATLLFPLLASLFPTQLLAITSGPAQEEFANFEPAQTTDMVNLYTGDFTYNIPLMNVPGPNGGYPINLFYNSGVGSDDAGSWVGLGWNLNVGAINRQLRGLPDDFDGDVVKQEMHLRRNFAVGIDVPKARRELFGFDVTPPTKWGGQIYYNNYRGLGYRVSANFGIAGFLNIGVSYDAQGGIGIDPTVSLSGEFDAIGAGLKFSTAYNSRRGLQGITLQTSLNYNTKYSKLGKTAKFTYGGTSSLTFGFASGVPDISVPTRTTHIDFDLGFATGYQWPLFNVNRWGNWKGFAEWSRVRNGGKDSRRAFGYLYTQNADGNDYKDFSRTGLAYSKKVPNLSTAAYTYDPLIVTGLGVGGQFRPYRSRVEILNTTKQVSRTDGHRINLEFAAGVGPSMHIGLGYAYTDGEQYSGPWRDGIPASLLDPTNDNTTSTFFQDAYYQRYGEQSGYLTGSDNQLEAWQGSEPLRPDLIKGSNSYRVDNGARFVNEKTGASLDADDYTTSLALGARTNRTPKADYLQRLTESQAAQYGFSRNLKYLSRSSISGEVIEKQKFLPGPDPNSGKISEIIVNKDDGFRYVYGLPALNHKQVDAAFNVYPPYVDENGNSASGDANTDLIQASGHTNNDASNQYESKKTLPKYAHSWLLTHIASPDYQDLTGDGMTADDPGSWMQFHYFRTTTTHDKYKWREPYAGASFAEAQKSNPADDMASYIYGEKDLFYLDKVETATHLAVFEVSPRDDATGVNDEANGGIATVGNGNKMYRLDRIKLYVKNVDGSWLDLATTTPIQTAVFNYADPYDQASIATLCDGIPSSELGVGKLTLAEVYLTSEQSHRGSLSPYRFYYGPDDAQHNPDYERRNRDRWGNYQNNTGLYPTSYPFVDFPYTNQYGPPNADAWQLQEITLPTGGKIKVDYEADDYAYEMDKPATQMFDIIGVGADPSGGGIIHNRFNGATGAFDLTNNDGNGNYRVYLHLSTPIPTTAELAELGLSADDYFRRYYLNELDQVYYKAFVSLTETSLSKSDYIAGYAELLKGVGQYGVNGPNGQHAFITLKGVPIQNPSFGERVHPFQRSALEHLKLNRSDLVNGYDPNESDPGSFVDQVANIIGSIFQFFEDIMTMSMGFNRFGKLRGWGSAVFLDGRSVLRLNNGTGFMYGGGSRVKKLSISNEWTYGAGPDEYGQQFDYTTTEGGRKISSGVAITPQGVGGEESALLYPADYRLSTPLRSSQNLFVEKPMMKGYYPGPSVGYRKVTVKSLADLIPQDIDKSYAPITIHEFYTHKDFPVREWETDLSSSSPIYDWAIFPPFGSKMKKHTARSQGYSIELNNMAGQMKSITRRTYPTGPDDDGILINRSEYLYRTEEPYSSETANRLSNEVPIIQPDGTMALGVIGQTHDIFHDFNENASKGNQYGADLNIDYLQVGIIPIIVPTLYPIININESSLRTAVTHKVIYKTGLLDRVEVTDGLSTISTKNIAYDPVTARPVLTRTTNEFKDYLYNYVEPAYWKYDDPSTGGMAGVYRNLDLEIENATMNGSTINFSNALSTHLVGDELWVQYAGTNGEKVYVTAVSASGISVQRPDGALPTYSGPVTLTTIRSGNRNQLTATAATTNFRGASSTGSTDAYNFLGRNNHILSTGVSTYQQDWASAACNEYYVPDNEDDPCSVANTLLALLNDIADPNIGPPINNDMTHLHANLYNLYPQSMSEDIWPNPADYWPYYNPDLYEPEDPYPALVPNELHIVFKDCSDCYGGCDIRLLAQNVPTNFDWEDVRAVTALWRTDLNDPYQFNVLVQDAAGNNYTAVSTLNTCYEICIDDGSGLHQGTPEVAQGRRRSSAAATTSVCDYVPEDCSVDANANPFVSGNKGAWRMHESHAFKVPRKYEGDYNGQARLREFGAYRTFVPFDWGTGANNAANGWVRSREITRYSPHGEITEEKNALENYSAAQYGYNQQLAVAVGLNMQQREIAFDNFEDYDKDCTDHFRFTNAQHLVNVVTDEAHTGKHSLRVAYDEEGPFVVKYLPGEGDPGCRGTFRPVPGERYLLSAWVKETEGGQDIRNTTQYDKATLRIQFCDGAPTVLPDIKASGVIIDGWQRVYSEFTVPANAEYFELRLLNEASSGSRLVYFDDLRMHPFHGNVNAYVYDRETYKVAATLDENNYATFTIRDQEGVVVKYNVETEEGIVTINEGTRHLKPN